MSFHGHNRKRTAIRYGFAMLCKNYSRNALHHFDRLIGLICSNRRTTVEPIRAPGQTPCCHSAEPARSTRVSPARFPFCICVSRCARGCIQRVCCQDISIHDSKDRVPILLSFLLQAARGNDWCFIWIASSGDNASIFTGSSCTCAFGHSHVKQMLLLCISNVSRSVHRKRSSSIAF